MVLYHTSFFYAGSRVVPALRGKVNQLDVWKQIMPVQLRLPRIKENIFLNPKNLSYFLCAETLFTRKTKRLLINRKGILLMQKSELLVLKRSRLAKMRSNGRNVKSPGVIRKVSREIRNLEK